MHHLGITFPVTPVEEIQHVLLKFLAILVDILPRLLNGQ